jgi:hypothetical protein
MAPNDLIRSLAWLAVAMLAGVAIGALILAGSVEARGTTQLTNWLAYAVMIMSGAASYLLFRWLTHPDELSLPLEAPRPPTEHRLSGR